MKKTIYIYRNENISTEMPRVLTAFKFCSLKPVIRNRTLSQIAINGDVSRHSCWPINLKKSSDGKTSYAPNRGATFCLVKLSIRFLITFKIWENIVRNIKLMFSIYLLELLSVPIHQSEQPATPHYSYILPVQEHALAWSFHYTLE